MRLFVLCGHEKEIVTFTPGDDVRLGRVECAIREEFKLHPLKGLHLRVSLFDMTTGRMNYYPVKRQAQLKEDDVVYVEAYDLPSTPVTAAPFVGQPFSLASKPAHSVYRSVEWVQEKGDLQAKPLIREACHDKSCSLCGEIDV